MTRWMGVQNLGKPDDEILESSLRGFKEDDPHFEFLTGLLLRKILERSCVIPGGRVKRSDSVYRDSLI